MALLATSMAGLPDAEDIGNVMKTHNTLSHFDYQTVGMNEASSHSAEACPVKASLTTCSSPSSMHHRERHIYNGKHNTMWLARSRTSCNMKTTVANSLGDNVNFNQWLGSTTRWIFAVPPMMDQQCRAPSGRVGEGILAVAFVLSVANYSSFSVKHWLEF